MPKTKARPGPVLRFANSSPEFAVTVDLRDPENVTFEGSMQAILSFEVFQAHAWKTWLAEVVGTAVKSAANPTQLRQIRRRQCLFRNTDA